MPYTIAVVTDPYLELLIHSDQAYKDRMWREFQKFPPADMFLTAVSRPMERYIGNLWASKVWENPPRISVHGPSVANPYERTPHMNFKIMSQTLSNKNGWLPNLTMLQTNVGLVNHEAQNDANIRMLDNKKHKPDLIVFIDTRDTIAHPGNINSRNTHDNSVFKAYHHAINAHPHTPTAVIV